MCISATTADTDFWIRSIKKVRRVSYDLKAGPSHSVRWPFLSAPGAKRCGACGRSGRCRGGAEPAGAGAGLQERCAADGARGAMTGRGAGGGRAAQRARGQAGVGAPCRKQKKLPQANGAAFSVGTAARLQPPERIINSIRLYEFFYPMISAKVRPLSMASVISTIFEVSPMRMTPAIRLL